VALAVVQVLLTLFYVTRVGGDFMLARFYVPITPFLYLAAEESVRDLGRKALMPVFASLVVAGTLFARLPRAVAFQGCTPVHGIVDERECYRPETTQTLLQLGGTLRRLLAGTQARVLVLPGQAMVAYFAALPYALESTGLTNRDIARQSLERRGRPGHEKGPTDDYLQTQLIHFRLLYGAHRTTGLEPYEVMTYEGAYLQIHFWDPAVMEALSKRPGVGFQDFRSYLDAYVQAPLGQLNKARLLAEYRKFQRFYFRHVADPERLARLQAALRNAGVADEQMRSAE
jgi:hypothetical protein